MFDDTLLMIALERTVPEKRMLLMSVRKTAEFERFQRLGWHISVAGILVSEQINVAEMGLEVVKGDVVQHPFSLMLGDLAAYKPEYLNLIKAKRPEVVKASFVTSPIDGGAFLLPDSSGQMPETATSLIETLRDAGYGCWLSSWFREDIPQRIREIDTSPEWLAARVRDAMPCNIIGILNRDIGTYLEFISEATTMQNDMILGRESAELADTKKEFGQFKGKRHREIKSRAEYIAMLADAMIAPSEKIKIG